MSFEVTIVFNKTRYHIKVEEVYNGDTVTRYEASAGEKCILLERRNDEKKFDKRWKIASVNWQFKDNVAAADFILQIMQGIDDEIDGPKLYSSYRPQR